MDKLQNILNFLDKFSKKDLFILWIFSIAVSAGLIALQLKNKLPLKESDFVFVLLIALLVALYRPRWMFFLFVSFVPLENIILASGYLPLQVRPYQFAGAVLILAIFILWLAKRLDFQFLKPIWLDWAIFSLVPLGIFSAFFSSYRAISLKNVLILASFVAFYFLARNFIRSENDLKESVGFFGGSFLVAVFYGFFQVFADKLGAKSFEVMFGRPNSTFAEPDWLGIFLCLSLAVFFALLKISNKRSFVRYFSYILIFLDFILIILTISRSAWLGAATATIFFSFLTIFEKTASSRTKFDGLKTSLSILFLFLLAIGAVQFGKLSKFDIFDRARSTATSEQKITISCQNGIGIPQSIANVDELPKYDCRFINLEDIESEKAQGKFVTQIFRKDPNVMTRGMIYQKSWEEIKKNPLLGVGFGTITQILGTDPRGAGLNESNIFLQIWAGSGIPGLVAFIAVMGYLFFFSFRHVSPVCLLRRSLTKASPMNKFFGCPLARDNSEKALYVFVVLGLIAIIVPNLFNAGLFMAIFWLALAAFVSISSLSQ